jgi:hypothetical protein
MAQPKHEPGGKPRFLVVENKLHYQLNAGGEMVLNLDLPMGIVLDAIKGATSQEEQFVAMLDALGDRETLEKFRTLGSISEGMPLVVKFFDEYARLAGASLGELSGSAPSSPSTDQL